jgi:hypothetical protein
VHPCQAEHDGRVHQREQVVDLKAEIVGQLSQAFCATLGGQDLQQPGQPAGRDLGQRQLSRGGGGTASSMLCVTISTALTGKSWPSHSRVSSPRRFAAVSTSRAENGSSISSASGSTTSARAKPSVRGGERLGDVAGLQDHRPGAALAGGHIEYLVSAKRYSLRHTSRLRPTTYTLITDTPMRTCGKFPTRAASAM